MVGKHWHIRCFCAVGVIVVFAVQAVAKAGNVADGDGRKLYSSAHKRQTPYDILRKTRRRPRTGAIQDAAEAGPVAARARLKYVRSAESSLITHLAMQQQKTTVVRPPELREAPADAPAEPVYFVLEAGDRDVHGITYRSTDRTKKVKLYLDTNGDGLFSDEREYVGTRLSQLQTTMTYEFGPVLTRHGESAPREGAIRAQCTNGQWLMFHPAFYREGRVVLNGRPHRIAVVDGDLDGKYNQVFVPPAKGVREPGCDAFAIDLDGDSKFHAGHPGGSEIMPFSRMVKVNEDYYSIHVTDDGGIIEFRQAKPSFGELDVGGREVDLRLWSDAAHQRLRGSGSKWRVPAGKYGVVSLELTEKDSAGNLWAFKIDKAGQGELGDFEVRPDEATSLRIGPPFRVKTSMDRSGPNVLIGFDLEGQAGELYAPGAKVNGKTVREPEFKIIDGSGRTVGSGRFKYG
ncbi:MAG: hypothetical protein CEE38_02145 [Planctomycetes bacterium B3_Pla]|nr:MAG: hypothetical protein CEE38_02145 [Planctomycetes bacterium B3_Pla]